MFRWNRLRIATAAVAIAAALGTGALAAAPADAAQAQQPHASGVVAPQVPGHRIKMLVPMPHQVGTQALSIVCYANIGGPAISGFNLVVTGVVTCNYPVTDLVLTVTLYWNGNIWGQGTDLATQTVAAYAQGPCIPGTFYGVLFLEVTWPPGVQGLPTYTTRTPSSTITSSFDC